VSQQNVDLVRQSFERFVETGEPVWELMHEDVEIRDHDIMDGSEYRGHAGFGQWLADWGAAWSSFEMEPQEYIDGGDCVIVVVHMRATGARSGIEVDRQDAAVNWLRDGKVARIDYFNNRDQALAAAGI